MSRLAVMEAVRHTFISFGGATAIDAVVPGGGKEGKTLCALVSWRGIGAITPSQAGWTEHYDFPDNAGAQFGFYTRPATDDEPDTYGFTFPAQSRVIATLWYISNSDNGIEVFSAEASGNSLEPTAPDAVSPGEDRLAIRIWNRVNVNNQIVPGDIFLRWNTGGAAGGAVGHVATKEAVGPGAVGTKTSVFEVSAQNWRAVTLIVGPGSQYLTKSDRIMAELSGFEGSISDRERQRLIHLTGPTNDSLMDLYKHAKAMGQSDGIPRIF